MTKAVQLQKQLPKLKAAVRALDAKVHEMSETLEILSNPRFWKAVGEAERGEGVRFTSRKAMRKHFGV